MTRAVRWVFVTWAKLVIIAVLIYVTVLFCTWFFQPATADWIVNRVGDAGTIVGTGLRLWRQFSRAVDIWWTVHLLLARDFRF